MKKLTTKIITTIITLSLLVAIAFASTNFTASDALIVLRASVGSATLNSEQLTKYEISDSPSAADALRILRLSVGTATPLITTTPLATTITTTAVTTAPIDTAPVSRTVYVTPTGSKYHYLNPCGNGNYSATTLDEALKLSRITGSCEKCVN